MELGHPLRVRSRGPGGREVGRAIGWPGQARAGSRVKRHLFRLVFALAPSSIQHTCFLTCEVVGIGGGDQATDPEQVEGSWASFGWKFSTVISGTSSKPGGWRALLLPRGPRCADRIHRRRAGASLEHPCAQGSGRSRLLQLFRCGFPAAHQKSRQTTGACSWSTLTTRTPLARLEAVGAPGDLGTHSAGSRQVGNCEGRTLQAWEDSAFLLAEAAFETRTASPRRNIHPLGGCLADKSAERAGASRRGFSSPADRSRPRSESAGQPRRREVVSSATS